MRVLTACLLILTYLPAVDPYIPYEDDVEAELVRQGEDMDRKLDPRTGKWIVGGKVDWRADMRCYASLYER